MWQHQIVEICKALSFNPKVLILDEPTSALAQNEVQRLFAAVRALRQQDIIIIYITHKLQELPQIADNVTVIRDGKVVGSAAMNDIDRRGIIHMMFGEVEIRNRPGDLEVHKEIVMEVRGLSRKGWFDDVSFQLRRGEVLGIAGMLGSGRTELLRSIFGADHVDGGTVFVEGREFANRNPSLMNRLGVGLTPEDRRREGLIMKHSVLDNLCYASMDKTANGWLEDRPKRRRFAQAQVDALEIKVPSIFTLSSTLSGGNQQKVVVGNWLNNKPKIMLYDEPSRGIDVNAKQQIFEIIWAQAREGIATLFVSTELEELLEVCHRILIMRHGRIESEIDPAATTTEELYTICMGG
jgi:ABC-type sugar transport system ATPase subunit